LGIPDAREDVGERAGDEVAIVLMDIGEEAAVARVVAGRPAQHPLAGRVRCAPRSVGLEDRHDVRGVLEQREDVGPVVLSGHRYEPFALRPWSLLRSRVSDHYRSPTFGMLRA